MVLTYLPTIVLLMTQTLHLPYAHYNLATHLISPGKFKTCAEDMSINNILLFDFRKL